MPKGRDILGTPPWKTKAATPAYRSGWDAVFDGDRPVVSHPDGSSAQHLPDQGPGGHDAPGEDGDLHDREVFDG